MVNDGEFAQEGLDTRGRWEPGEGMWALFDGDELVYVGVPWCWLRCGVEWWWCRNCCWGKWLGSVCLGGAKSLLVVQECLPDTIHECQVLEKVCGEFSVALLPVGEVLAHSDHLSWEECDSCISGKVRCIIATFVLLLDLAVSHHLVCGVAFYLGDLDALGALGGSMLVIHSPQIAILVESPRTFG